MAYNFPDTLKLNFCCMFWSKKQHLACWDNHKEDDHRYLIYLKSLNSALGKLRSANLYHFFVTSSKTSTDFKNVWVAWINDWWRSNLCPKKFINSLLAHNHRLQRTSHRPQLLLVDAYHHAWVVMTTSLGLYPKWGKNHSISTWMDLWKLIIFTSRRSVVFIITTWSNLEKNVEKKSSFHPRIINLLEVDSNNWPTFGLPL